MKKLLFAVALCFISGCVQLKSWSSLVPPSQAELSAQDSSRLIQSLFQARATVRTAKSLAGCREEAGSKRLAQRVATVVERPDRMRLEQLPLQGFYTLSTLTLRGDEVWWVDAITGQRESGRIGDRVLERFLPIPLRESDLLDLTLGSLPLRALESAGGKWYQGDNETLAVFEDLIGVLDQRNRLTAVSIFDGAQGKEVVRLQYVYGEKPVPESFHIEIPRYEVTIDCHYTAMQINAPINPAMFDPQ